MGWFITLAILFLLAILPLGATVRFNEDGLGLKVIAGPIRIPILPAKKKDPVEKKQKEPKAKKETYFSTFPLEVSQRIISDQTATAL